MKKIIGFAVVAAAAMSLAAAEISVGARGIFGLGLGTSLGKSLNDMDAENGTDLNFGATAFLKTPVNDKFFVQPELGITHNIVGAKMETKESKTEQNLSYNALEIPILFVLDFKAGENFTVSPIAGPKFSFLLGNPTMETNMSAGGTKSSTETEYEAASPFLFSVVVGASVSRKAGPGVFVCDLRYNIGVTELKHKNGNAGVGNKGVSNAGVGNAEVGFAMPRSLQISVGYQISF